MSNRQKESEKTCGLSNYKKIVWVFNNISHPPALSNSVAFIMTCFIAEDITKFLSYLRVCVCVCVSAGHALTNETSWQLAEVKQNLKI